MRWLLLMAIVLGTGACCGKCLAEATCDAGGGGREEWEEEEREVPEDVGLVDPALNELQQDDPRLIEIIREKYLIPPSDQPYNFTSNTVDIAGQYDQPKYVEALLKDKYQQTGFFVEAGAHDGEYISNSLLFELKHQWKGLLVEPVPWSLEALKKKRRKAWIFPQCLSTKTTPEIVEFDVAGLAAGIINQASSKKPADDAVEELAHDARRGSEVSELVLDVHIGPRRTVRMQCFPFYSVLLALGNPTVHYFSLDIEGAEYPVLKSIPFDKVDIKILGVETNHLGHIFPGSVQQLHKLLTKEGGYQYMSKAGVDEFFIKKDFEVNHWVNPLTV